MGRVASGAVSVEPHAGRHRNRAPEHVPGQGIEPIPQGLRQRGRGVEHEPETGEEPCREVVVVLEVRKEHGEPGGTLK